MSIPKNSEDKLRECCLQEIVQTHVLAPICSSLWRSYLSWPGNHLRFLLFPLLSLIKPCSSCGNRCRKVTFICTIAVTPTLHICFSYSLNPLVWYFCKTVLNVAFPCLKSFRLWELRAVFPNLWYALPCWYVG